MIPPGLPQEGPFSRVSDLCSQWLLLFYFRMLLFVLPSRLGVLLSTLLGLVTSVALVASTAFVSDALVHHIVSKNGEQSRERTVGHLCFLSILRQLHC